MIAEIIPAVKTGNNMSVFTYLVPEALTNTIKIGSIATMPFGKRKITGVVVNLKNEVEAKSDFKLKEILDLNECFLLPEVYIEIAKWVSDYYLCSLGEAINLFLPPEMKRPRKEIREIIDNKPVIADLSTDQEKIFQEILKSLNNKAPKKPILIHGVTGSGKTEVYIALVNEVLKKGKSSIILVPEIILTPQTVLRFQKAFGDKTTLVHSNLSKSEKLKCYQDFYFNKKPILIGPRSALLVPNEKLGLIIIDEEHEDSYKQEQNPRYHARELAIKIGEKTNSLVVMGSATPSVEVYAKAVKDDGRRLFCLNKRYGKECMPKVSVIDLKNEMRSGNYSPISEKLREMIENTLANKRQILLFLNRRGAATFVSCRNCGYIATCKNCAIPLIYHLDSKYGYLTCHHCDFKSQTPNVCPECGSSKIKFYGTGIQKIEQEINALFPTARVFRADASTMRNKNDYKEFYDKLRNHEIDIAIGTQIIAKGLDIPKIDLVGVISADTGINMPHYKASEKTFQLLTQVAGRCGRQDNIGQTIIQSYWPDSIAITAASKHDYEKFFTAELIEREKYNYPPFCNLLRIVVEKTTDASAKNLIQEIAAKLKKQEIDYIGPANCFYSKMHQKYRHHLLIKFKGELHGLIPELKQEFPEAIFDVDPVNFL